MNCDMNHNSYRSGYNTSPSQNVRYDNLAILCVRKTKRNKVATFTLTE